MCTCRSESVRGGQATAGSILIKHEIKTFLTLHGTILSAPLLLRVLSFLSEVFLR